MRAAVVTFPGSNCDDDLVFALSVSDWQVDRLWHKDRPELDGYDLVALPGGFSFGDYLRCGAIAALSPITEKVRAFAEKGGSVIGMCNGFQILCEMGLLPGALAPNEGLKFVCKDIWMRVVNHASPWTCATQTGDVICLPIAHGDGRYVISNDGYEELLRGKQVLLTYSDAAGKESPGSNPNGSLHSIAGICNGRQNVFGLMPHPERATDLRSRDGMKIWNSITQRLREKKA
jgi:phosphoribosylformylglycinamidine synthase